MTPEKKTLSEHIYSVSELTRDIKLLLEVKFPAVSVEGEVSNLRPSSAGHLYFTLKDDFSQIQAVIFKSTYIRKTVEIKDGLKILATGSINVYEPRGSYQLIITKVVEKGAGELQLAFEKLKQKLFEEGLFDESHKKKLPLLPVKIGVMTSPTGAAIRDILNVLDRRFSNLHVIINPVRVQGNEAAPDIVSAIDEFNEMKNVDVVIVGRGGGSLEDLWPFNEEIVARAIYRSKIPVISAVGHEIDYTISDLVADVRAPTPSAAAELVITAKKEFEEHISNLERRLCSLVSNGIHKAQSRLKLAIGHYVFRQPQNIILRYRQMIDDFSHRALLHTRHITGLFKNKVESLLLRLHGINPSAVLSRGYSITLDENNHVLKNTGKISQGSKIKTLLHRGSIISSVEKLKEDGWKI